MRARAEPQAGRIAEWVPASRGEIICYTHLPERPAAAGVVICSPLYFEGAENRRAEVLLATALARAGIAVQRFDYCGFGNSRGDPRELTLRAAVGDCLIALDRLCEHTGSGPVGIAGTRWGGLVAAGAAARCNASAVVLWEPVRDSRAFVEELARTRAFRDLHRGSTRPLGSYVRRLERGQRIDVGPWRVEGSVVRGSASESLTSWLASRKPAVRLVLHQGAVLADELASVGCAVTACELAEPSPWSWAPPRHLSPGWRESPLELEASATADWFVEALTTR